MRGGVPVFSRAVGKPRRRSATARPRAGASPKRPSARTTLPQKDFPPKKSAGRKDNPSSAIAGAAGADDATNRAPLDDQAFDQTLDDRKVRLRLQQRRREPAVCGLIHLLA